MDADSDKPVYDQFVNPADVVSWVEQQPEESRVTTAQSLFDELFARSSRSRGASGNSCMKLCGFVEHCTKSQVPEIRQWAFTEDLSLRLFTFFIEWNEVEQHRGMRLVLDLLPILFTKNPSAEAGDAIKTSVLDTLIAIIGRKSTKPLIKSSLKALDQFTLKGYFTVKDIGQSYRRVHPSHHWEAELELWDEIFSQLFLRMGVWYIRAIAGKFVVTLYQAVRRETPGVVQGKNGEPFTVKVWHQWLQNALATSSASSLLDSMKNYIFLPLFKDNRKDSLLLLEEMKKMETIHDAEEHNVDRQALLRFSALEIGKKVGIVEEPDTDEAFQSPSSVILEETMLDGVLAHPSSQVRAFALSLVVSSNSSTRPFSEPSLRLLKVHLPHAFSDPGAKFRMELLSKVKIMYKRARSAIPLIRKAIDRADTVPRDPGLPPKSSKTSKVGLSTEALKSWPIDRLRTSLRQHREFLHWFLDFLKSELIPTASYQRHYSILRGILFIIRAELDGSKAWETNEQDFPFFDQFDATWTRPLFDLVMDAYDDVRATSVDILKHFFSDKRFVNVVKVHGASHLIADFLSRAEALAHNTSRADHADGVARTYELLYRFRESKGERLLVASSLVDSLEEKISIAEGDLGKAVLEAPVHSYFAALRFVWQAVTEAQHSEIELEDLGTLQSRIVRCCQRIWASVKHVLCDDSPEGNMPQELEDTEGLDTKDLLSYSFRAIHESSNLMRTMVVTLRSKSQSGKLRPSTEDFAVVGCLTFDQLKNLRHRGAFSTVSLTFATCCQLTKHLGSGSSDLPKSKAFLDAWYNQSLDCILTHASTTRRSAGIPSMITGILTANADSPSFEKVMGELVKVASKEAFVSETDGSNLPQVHALNCLKDILKNSQLAQTGKVEAHIPQCLGLAAGCLKSEVWAIRNSGLLLLRSLVDSLFGTNESKAEVDAGWDGKATRLHYHRYPILPEVILNLLRSGHDVMKPSTGTTAAEAVFPALDIIRRAGPPETSRDELCVLVAEYLGSPVWHVREMAARALCSFFLRDDWIASLMNIMNSKDGQPSDLNKANRLHGVILTIRYVFERLTDVMPALARQDLSQLLDILIGLYQTYPGVFSRCPEVQSAYVEVLNLVCGFAPRDKNTSTSAAQSVAVAGQGRNDSLSGEYATRALLDGQMAIQSVHYSHETANLASLRSRALETSVSKPEAAVDMLEAIPNVFRLPLSSNVASELCLLYVEVCGATAAAEPRAVALENLAGLMDYLLARAQLDVVPSDEDLSRLWRDSADKPLNPSVSDALLRLSGCVMAAKLSRRETKQHDSVDLEIKNWSAMIADAGLADMPFDTRFAATQSLKSFLATCTSSSEPPFTLSHLPVLITLYDALNDDDDEVRDLAADAARPLLHNVALLPPEAADRLLRRVCASPLGRTEDFIALVASRMVGASGVPGADAAAARTRPRDAVSAGTGPNPETSWPSARDQLNAALDFDDALFAVEEQNLYIDEVRESRRWAGAFGSIFNANDRGIGPRGGSSSSSSSSPYVGALASWTLAGLDALTAHAEANDDGPMGWTSQPDVYAVCARVVLCGVSLARSARLCGFDGGDEAAAAFAAEDVRRGLQKLRRVGGEKRFHGLLLELMDDGTAETEAGK